MAQIPIWLASNKRARSIFKFIVYDEQGTLILSNFRLEYKGASLVSGRIVSSEFAYQAINWPLHLAAWALFLLLRLDDSGHLPSIQKLLLYFGIYLVIVSFIFSLRWVKVVVGLKDGTQREIYVCDGRFFGWGALLGRNRSLYSRIKAAEQGAAANP